MKKLIVFGKHYEKINSVFGERLIFSLALCSEFLLRVKKKLNEGPGPGLFFDRRLHSSKLSINKLLHTVQK